MSPVLPSEFTALLPTATDTLAQVIVKSCIKFPLLFFKWHKYVHSGNGNFTGAFAQTICTVRNNCS